MKKIALIAFASTAALALSACGGSNDASEDATADSVEMPADEALTEAAPPVADDTATTSTAASAPTVEETEIDAAQAADDAQAAVDDAVAAAEDAAQ